MKTERFEMRIEKSIKRKLELLAKADNRSMSEYLDTLIKNHIKGKEGDQ